MRTGLGILLLSFMGAACGKTSEEGPASGAPEAGSNAGGIGSATGGPAGGGGTSARVGGSGGVDELSYVDLTGAPIYTRVQRLTNSQWENAVTDILRLQRPPGLSAAFNPPISNVTSFDNNEQVLFVDQPRFIDFESGAEAAAALATGSAEALAALHSGDDSAGLVSALGRRAFRRPLTDDEATKYRALRRARLNRPAILASSS